MKIKESEKIDKYLNHAKKLKNYGTYVVMLIPIVFGVLGMVPKRLERGLEQSETKGRVTFKLQHC